MKYKLTARQLGLIASMALLFVVLFSALYVTPARAEDDKWRVRYYANKNLSGDPVRIEYESKIDHRWDGSPADGVPSNNFSAKWTRRVHFNAGVYRFSATMDDGMRVWVNDNKIIDSWNDSQVHTVVTDIYIPAGDHDLKVEYYQATGGAIAQFSWGPAGSTTVSGWLGEYFNNVDLFGQPSVTRSDTAINFDWGLERPADGINKDDFSVRWTRSLELTPGVYRFTTTTDDGVRLWVNNQLVIDKWQNQTVTSYSADVEVAGNAAVKMEYFESRDYAVARLDYTKISSTTSGGGFLPPVSELSGWDGTYYNNTNFDDASVMVRLDPEINFIWGSSSPQPNVVNADRFSVRWINNHNFPAGRYRFTTYVDGGVRLWVNNELIIDEWKDPYKTVEYANVIDLPGGSVPLRMDFFEDVGLAEARLVITPENGSGTAVTLPSSSSTTDTAALAPMTAQVINARVLNVRSGPSMDDEPFTHVSGGDVVELTGCRNAGWIEIRLPDGTTGWVGGSYLSGNFDYNSLQTCVSGAE
jgi:hypothetical protein